jgi:hypothetical protein
MIINKKVINLNPLTNKTLNLEKWLLFPINEVGTLGPYASCISESEISQAIEWKKQLSSKLWTALLHVSLIAQFYCISEMWLELFF